MNKINRLIVWFILSTFIILLGIFCFVNVEYNTKSLVLSNNQTYLVCFDKQTKNYINKNEINKCNIESNLINFLFYIYFKEAENDQYWYYLNPTESDFYLDNGSYSLTIKLGKITLVSYIFNKIYLW